MKLINLHSSRSPEEERSEFLSDVRRGFRRSPKSIPFKYLYDRRGSELFERIMTLDSYYPTEAERSILRDFSGQITERFEGRRLRLVDLGSGNSLKTQHLLDALKTNSTSGREVSFLPVDISTEFLRLSAAQLQAQYDGFLQVVPVAGDFYKGIDWALNNRTDEQTILYFPGSTIGNFEPEEAIAFLRFASKRMQAQDFFLLSTDMVKDEAILNNAYNDEEGVTAAFILNLLDRMNRELGTVFDPQNFGYKPTYNPTRACMEMRLESFLGLGFSLAGEAFELNKNEAILVERSHKFRADRIKLLLAKAGLEWLCSWSDERNYFSINLARRAQ